MKDKQLLQAILRTDLKSFICKVFDTINPGIAFNNAWYLDLIADHLESIEYDAYKRLVINIPPRCLKSVSISVAWPAWLLGRQPHKRIIVASYSEQLSIKHSLDCRAVMQSQWYQELFPQTVISPSHNRKNKFMTTQFGFRMAASVGGSITGEGADILIVDDPHNPTYIHSEKIRSKAIQWFEQTFISRLNDQQRGAIVVVMQRLHKQDLSGHLEKQGGWRELKIPAISDQAMTFRSPMYEYHFMQGKLLDEARLPLKILEKMKQEIGIANFKAQYLQDPEEQSRGMLKNEEIRYYDVLPIFESIYQSWDTAIKVNDTSDYSVCTTWGVFQSKYYLIDCLCQKLEYVHLKDAAIKLSQKWMPRVILIEDKASGQSLIQDLKMHNIHNIIPQRPKIDKLTRFALVVPFFTLEQVLLPQKASWVGSVIAQITAFPYASNDDIVDSISQFLNYIKQENYLSPNPRIRNI
jgi:predicted phage terminase large subunit-like protein